MWRVLPILAMLVGVLFIYRDLVAGRVLAGGDLQVYFYPYWVSVVRALRDGHLPLWNPTLFAGAPLAANSQVGLFYPLNWGFWLLSPATLSGIARALHLSVLVHVGLAALNVYLLSCSIGVHRWAASAAGLIYAGCGFLGVHIDHLNQLQALAWLPLLFLPPMPAGGRLTARGFHLPHPVSIVAMGMTLLSGHSQMAFIAAVGVVIWHTARTGLTVLSRARSGQALSGVGVLWWKWLAGLLPFVIAGFLAGVQLVPTLQLMGLSGRSVGLDWRESVSFSLAPWKLPQALLPSYLVSPHLPEGVAYIGLSGLFAAVLGLVAVVRHRHRAWPWVILACAGVFLALGAYNPLYLLLVRLHVPGFIHFRAPARFLALYVLGTSILAGIGIQEFLGRQRVSSVRGKQVFAVICEVALILAAGFEATLAAEALPHAQATAPRAYTDLRPATAHLVAASEAARKADLVPARFLSISQMLFEIGDKAEIEMVYRDRLSADALWSYMVAAKQREILAPNLPLVFDVPSVDGYDGGLLPLRRFMAFSELLVPGGTLDGRLRENLLEMPDSRWLDLLGVQYVLTDKTGDWWVGDILYDRQFQPVLTGGESLRIGWLPSRFDANALALLYEGGPVKITWEFQDGRVLSRHIPAGGNDNETTWIRWTEAATMTALEFEVESGESRLIAVSLVDERAGAFYPLVLSDQYWLAHSGDVKIYEAVNTPSRVEIVHACEAVGSREEALQLMRTPEFVPSELIVLEDMPDWGASCDSRTAPLSDFGAEQASIVRYADHEVVVDVVLNSPGYLLLKDAWYPGWEIHIQDLSQSDGEAKKLSPLLADLLFRAVPLDAGSWRVTFSYGPYILYAGLVLTLCGLIGLAVYTVSILRHEG